MGFLIRWRPRKLAQRGDQQLLRTHFLLDARGVQIDPRRRAIIEQRLTRASDLRQDLENKTLWTQIKQARLFSEWVDETLRTVEGVLPPGPPNQIRRLHRPIHS